MTPTPPLDPQALADGRGRLERALEERTAELPRARAQLADVHAAAAVARVVAVNGSHA